MITSFVKFTIKGFLAYVVAIKYRKIVLIFCPDSLDIKKDQDDNKQDLSDNEN